MKIILAVFISINIVALFGYTLHYFYCLCNTNKHTIASRLFLEKDWWNSGYYDMFNSCTLILIVIDTALSITLLTVFLVNNI